MTGGCCEIPNSRKVFSINTMCSAKTDVKALKDDTFRPWVGTIVVVKENLVGFLRIERIPRPKFKFSTFRKGDFFFSWEKNHMVL